MASLLLLSWDLWFLGYPDQSLARVVMGKRYAIGLCEIPCEGEGLRNVGTFMDGRQKRRRARYGQ